MQGVPLQYWQLESKRNLEANYDGFFSGAMAGGLGFALIELH